MATTVPLGWDPEFVELQVGDEVRIATELAALTKSKPVSDFVETILVAHLLETGFLTNSSRIDC